MATTSVVDSTTGQNTRSPGTRAGLGPDHAARSAELTSRHAPVNSTRWNGEISRPSPWAPPTSVCQTVSPATATMASPTPTSASRYPAGTARSDHAPRRWFRVRIQAAVTENPRNNTPCHGVSPPSTPFPWLQPSRYNPSTSSNEHHPVTRSSHQLARRPSAARCLGEVGRPADPAPSSSRNRCAAAGSSAKGS